MTINIKTRITLWGLLAATTLWLVWQAIVPFGRIAYSTDLPGRGYFIQKLTPDERVRISEDGRVLVTGDPVYFNLRSPRRFDRAVLTIKYTRGEMFWQVPTDTPIIEAGVLADKTVWRYDLKPLENNIIDRLSFIWHTARAGRTILLQKEKKYNSVADFLAALPPREEIGVYNFWLPAAETVPDYEAATGTMALTYGLKGAYQFYTYIDNEDLDFTFSFVDLNLNRDPDPVEIYLYHAGAAIDSRRLEDDGITDDTGVKSDRRELELRLAALPAGFYKIEVKANDDIVTKQITTAQRKLAFIGKFELAAEDRTDITLYTDSLLAHFLTADPAKLQTIAIGDEDFELNETYKQLSARLKGTATEITLAKDGVIVAGDGVFSFSPDALINPDYRRVSGALDLDSAGINYVIADYEAPEEKDGVRTARTEFDLGNAYREFGRYGFVISIPGLKADDEIDDYIEIMEIRIDLEGKSLWEKVKEVIGKTGKTGN